MKKLYTWIIRSTVLLSALLMGPLLSSGQQNTQSKITSIEKTVAEFQNITVEDNFDIYIFEGTAQKVIIETEEQDINNIVTNVVEGNLHIFRYHKLKESKIKNIFITVTDLFKITTSGKCNIKFFYNIEDLDLEFTASSAKVNLLLKSPKFNCNIFGKGHVQLNGIYEDLSFSLFDAATLSLDISSAILTLKTYDESEATLAGFSENLILKIFDESTVEATKLTSKNCNIYIKDSGDAFVSTLDKLEIFGEQEGFVEYRGNPVLNIIASKYVKIKRNKENMFANEK